MEIKKKPQQESKKEITLNEFCFSSLLAVLSILSRLLVYIIIELYMLPVETVTIFSAASNNNTNNTTDEPDCMHHSLVSYENASVSFNKCSNANNWPIE